MVYNACLGASWPFIAFYYFLKCRTSGRYCRSRRQRLGLALPPFLARHPRVWFHALSVGETLSVIPLVKALKETHPHMDVVFSSATETGWTMAQERLASWVSEFFYLPHDFPWIGGQLARRVKPHLFVLVETDIWPNLLSALRRQGVPSILVNGRLSPRSFQRLMQARAFARPVFRMFDFIFAQSSQDVMRYIHLGASSNRVASAGNLKFDAALTPVRNGDVEALRGALGIESGRRVWIAGSTHEGEEEMVLEVHRTLRKEYPDLLLILAPRQVQRAGEIRFLARRHGFSVGSRSAGDSAVGSSVFVLDTLGELSACYALAGVAFIGGSLVPSGGHNPLEAVVHGKPAVWGPHLFNFRQIELELIQAGCGMRVGSSGELAAVVGNCLGGAAMSGGISPAAKDFLASQAGCSRKILSVMMDLLNRKGAADRYS